MTRTCLSNEEDFIMKKKTKVELSLVVGVILILGGWLFLQSQIYQPSLAAKKAAEQATVVKNNLVFQAKLSKAPMVIFYPGALVEPKSYSIWAKKLSAAGYPVYIVRFPMDLAVLAPNKANEVRNKNDRDYVIGGHSLGGVMASRYAQKHQKNLKGVFFLASYPDKKGSLKKTSIPVLSITASRDGVLNKKAYKKAKQWLPTRTTFEVIRGGNHAGFGSYGKQKGDRTATISTAEQQQEIARYLINWLKNIK